MKFFLTGHTGFKGAWLLTLLSELGHEVVGFSDSVESGSLYEITNCASLVTENYTGDVRDIRSLKSALNDSEPDFLIHLAAQSLVRRSYLEPANTFEVNVGGTINVLAAGRECTSVKGALIVTTDKVYAPNSTKVPHHESDPLQGFDPYSSSKALADQYVQEWIKHANTFPIGIARAGNVIGGGDICADRLVPEVFRSMDISRDIELRFPHAVRPWQHVLDCLAGYIGICAHIMRTGKSGVWNIGPDQGSYTQVYQICEKLIALNNSSISWRALTNDNLPESDFLSLDTRKAKLELEWSNMLSLDESLLWTSRWYTEVKGGESPHNVVISQIKKYTEILNKKEIYFGI
jgi:CDP-glucose 4,6-dehydratase